jgi:hypothetical protein
LVGFPPRARQRPHRPRMRTRQSLSVETENITSG